MLLTRILAVSLFPATVLTAQAPGAARDAAPTISSSATAEAKFAPDRATITIAVQTKAPTAVAAAADNSKKQNSVMSSLRALGLTNEQLSTTGYSVNPEYRYDPNSPPRLTGYTVTNTVLVDIHDLKTIGKILDTALANGSNVISSLDFYASNTDSAKQQALADAVGKARAAAAVAARAAGGTLGALIHLNVGGGEAPPPTPLRMFSAKMAAASVPETQINPGQQSLTVSVSGSWTFVAGS
jgi:uncharacterized protein YggE